VTDHLRLTDLQAGGPGLRRALHGYGTAGTWRRVLHRYAAVFSEVVAATPRDVTEWVGFGPRKILRIEPGVDPEPDATRVALYVHYAPSGRVSDMVRCQLRALRQTGFAIAFISSSDSIPEKDWQAVRQICALAVQRRNFGLDFGAWHDTLPEVCRRWPDLEELMLANDSVMGPLYPMAPLVQALRSGGEGLFGLTESLQGGAHLQTYMLLGRGRLAVADLSRFIRSSLVSHSKWMLVQIWELRLARWMRRRGHRVAALFGYERVIRTALADPEERARLAASHERLGGLAALPLDEAVQLLQEWPLNPTQHLWHVLVARCEAPFVKTQLIRHNPGRLLGVADWPAVVPPDSPCPLPVLRAHLTAMGPD
jgi:Rhamnan synthesis protein F